MSLRGRQAEDLVIGPRSARPDRRVDLYLILAGTFAACSVYVAALLIDVLPPRGLAIPFYAAAPLAGLFAVVILEMRWRADGDGRLAWVSGGVAVAVAAMVLQLISFPLVAPSGGFLDTSDQANASLYLLFHLALGAGVLAGALEASTRWRVPTVLAGLAVAVLLALDVIPLPVLLRSGVRFTPAFIAATLLVAALTTTAAVLWVLRVGRSAPTLHGWVGVAASLAVYDLVLVALAAERYDALWWGSLSFRDATFLVLGFGSLAAVLRRLRDAESYGESELDRRESQLRSSLAVTAGLLSSAQDVSRAVRSFEVADVLCANARAMSGATYASVVIGRHGEHLRLLGASGYDESMRRELTHVDWDLRLPAPHVLATGSPLFLDTRRDVRDRFPMVADLPMGEASALAALPIVVGQEPIGVLSVWDVQPRAWSANQRRVLEGLAAQGAQAIARAQAYEEQATAARTLQTSLLPAQLPQPGRLDLAACYLPAEDRLLVGGDWYDSLVLDDDHIVLVVGDVMGKGLHAAAQMGQIRVALRSVASLDPSPAAVLTALDDLNLELGPDEIVTLVYVLVDTARGTARVARAGHLPPIVTSPDGTVRVVEEGGSGPLGAPRDKRVEAEVDLPPGGLLVLYTDGLVEDRATGLEEGTAQLAACLRDMAPYRQPTESLAIRVLELCPRDRHEDDLALLVARYTAGMETPTGLTGDTGRSA